jgi:hypothetical protein
MRGAEDAEAWDARLHARGGVDINSLLLFSSGLPPAIGLLLLILCRSILARSTAKSTEWEMLANSAI